MDKKQAAEPQTIWTRSEYAQAGLLEHILEPENLKKAIDAVRAQKPPAGPDGITLDEAISDFETHQDEIVAAILKGQYTAATAERKEVVGHDATARVIAVPNIRDRIVQQAFAQELAPVFEQRAIKGTRAKGRAEAVRAAQKYYDLGFKYAARVYLSRQMDSAQRSQFVAAVKNIVDDERVVQIIKEFVKSGIMAEGVVSEPALAPKKVSPMNQLLANVYLDALDKEMGRREVPIVRYADEILVFAPSERAAQIAQTAACQFLKDRMKVAVKGKKTDILPTNEITIEL